MIAGLVGLLLLAGAHSPGDTLSAVFWNLENFFDWRNDSTSVSDADFSSRGSRRWTRRRFGAKCQGVAKTLLWSSSVAGRLPDIVGVAEVENAFVLRRLLRDTPLRKLDYAFVHFDSPDRRGIDVGLLYRKGELELVDAKPCHLYDDSLRVMPTRDILLCRFRLKGRGPLDSGGGGAEANPGYGEGLAAGTGYGYGGDHAVGAGSGDGGEFAVLVNHHPSKFGGAAESEGRRRAAVGRLRFLADSLAAGGLQRILAFGDFNDTPANPLFKALEPRLSPLYGTVSGEGEGTIRFDGRWELIDLAFASPALAPASPVTPAPATPGPTGWTSPMRILRPPFLRAPDRAHGGWKPLRTYTGPRYNGGLSDHCPIQVDLYMCTEKCFRLGKNSTHTKECIENSQIQLDVNK